MKPLRWNILVRNVMVALISVTLIWSLSSCATKASFATSSVVPAAKGYVKIKKDNNNNFAIQIQISDLAEVGRIQPSHRTYIVWVVSDNYKTKNIGRINSSAGTFSKKRKATFETVTSFKPAKIFITTEDDENVSYPSTEIVLSTNRF